jgi:biotin operon repressor
MLYEKAFAIERRLAELLRLIFSGKHSARTLAEKLGVSIPTVSRDITALRQRGYQIRSVRLPHHWAYELISTPETVSHGQVSMP